MSNVCRLLGGGLSAFIDGRKSSDIRSTMKWISEHIDNAIDAGATVVRIYLRKGIYRCIDNGTGISPNLAKPNWPALFELGNHDNPDGYNRIGQHGYGGKYASLNITGGAPYSTIKVYTLRKGETSLRVAGMSVGDIIRSNSEITWDNYKNETTDDFMHQHGTIVEVASTHNRLLYMRTHSREISLGLGRIYYKAIQNGLRIIVDSERPETVRPRPIGYIGGKPEVSFSFRVAYPNPVDECSRLIGEIHCSFGQITNEFMIQETKNNYGTGVRLVHKQAGRFINQADLQSCDFVDGYPIGFAGEIILGDVSMENDSVMPDLRWPLTSTKDELCQGVLNVIKDCVLENKGFVDLVDRLRKRTQDDELKIMSDNIEAMFNDTLGEIVKKEWGGKRKVYPKRPPSEDPMPIKKPGTNRPWADGEDLAGDKESKFSKGAKIDYNNDLPPETDLIKISPNGLLITINMNYPNAREMFKPPSIHDCVAFQRMTTALLISYYMSFRPTKEREFSENLLNCRHDEAVEALSKFINPVKADQAH